MRNSLRCIFDPKCLEAAENAIFTTSLKTLHNLQLGAPQYSHETVEGVRDEVGARGLSCGMWDKHLHMMYAFCDKAMDQRIASDMLLGTRFKIWGFADTPWEARAIATQAILLSSIKHNITEYADWLGLKLDVTKAEDINPFIVASYLPIITFLGTTKGRGTGNRDNAPPRPSLPPVRPPSAFPMVKWKSDEMHPTSPLLKYRDVITFVGVPLAHFSKIVGRCLDLLILHAPERL